MNPRYATLPAVLLLLAAALATPGAATAAGTPRTPIVDEGGTDLPGSAPQNVAGVCLLQPSPTSGVAVTLGPDDVWRSIAWRIPMNACTACPAPQALLIHSLSFRIRWYGACSAQAEVSIVGATGPAACRVPDPGHVLCGPVTYAITNPGAAGSVTYTLPLPAGCCVSGEAFAQVRFTGLENCTNPVGGYSPALAYATNPSVQCDQYFTSSIGYPTLTDWWYPGTTEPEFWMALDADCCTVTGVDHRSWGTIKLLYR